MVTPDVFFIEISRDANPRGSNLRSPKALALTTWPLLYIRLVRHGLPSHVMENQAVPIVHTRVVEWSRREPLEIRDCSNAGSNPSVMNCVYQI